MGVRMPKGEATATDRSFTLHGGISHHHAGYLSYFPPDYKTIAIYPSKQQGSDKNFLHANPFRLKIVEDISSKIVLRDATLMIFLQELDLSQPTFAIMFRRA